MRDLDGVYSGRGRAAEDLTRHELGICLGYHVVTTEDSFSADELQQHVREKGLLRWSTVLFNPARNLPDRQRLATAKGET